MFKYQNDEVDIEGIKKHAIKDVISYKQYGQKILLDIRINNEEYSGWVEGENLLPDLLPLYEEIREKNYQLLVLISAINDAFTDKEENELSTVIKTMKLSSAQQAFLDSVAMIVR